MTPRALASLWVLVACLAPAAASAERRLAVVVGNHRGTPEQPTLQAPRRDANAFRALLIAAGHFKDDDVELLIDQSELTIKGAIQEMDRQALEEQKRGVPVMEVLYYSGHGLPDGTFALGEGSLSAAYVRDWADSGGRSGLTRVVIADSCFSGMLAVPKGAALPATAFKVQLESAKGGAILTSAAEREYAADSPDQLSPFTRILIAGLEGAADKDKDGKITLAEAHNYAQVYTHVAAEQQNRAQNPALKSNTGGSSGEIYLSFLADVQAILQVPSPLRGKFTLRSRDQRPEVLEAGKDVVRDPGDYLVEWELTEETREAEVTLKTREKRSISELPYKSVLRSEGLSKGAIRNVELLGAFSVASTLPAGVGLRATAGGSYRFRWLSLQLLGEYMVPMTVRQEHLVYQTSSASLALGALYPIRLDRFELQVGVQGAVGGVWQRDSSGSYSTPAGRVTGVMMATYVLGPTRLGITAEGGYAFLRVNGSLDTPFTGSAGAIIALVL